MKRWTQLFSFRHPMLEGRPRYYFAVAVFLSLVINALLGYLLCFVLSGRKTVEPRAPAAGRPLILSLPTFSDVSRYKMEPEAVTSVQLAVPSIRGSQSSTGPLSSDEPGTEDAHDSETPDNKYPATGITPSFDLEAAYRMTWEFKCMKGFEAEPVISLIDKGIPNQETHVGKSLAVYLTPSFSLETAYRVEREFGSMSEYEIQNVRIKPRMLYIKNFIDEYSDSRRNCRTAYSGAGILAIPLLIRDAITGNGCKWEPVIK